MWIKRRRQLHCMLNGLLRFPFSSLHSTILTQFWQLSCLIFYSYYRSHCGLSLLIFSCVPSQVIVLTFPRKCLGMRQQEKMFWLLWAEWDLEQGKWWLLTRGSRLHTAMTWPQWHAPWEIEAFLFFMLFFIFQLSAGAEAKNILQFTNFMKVCAGYYWMV